MVVGISRNNDEPEGGGDHDSSHYNRFLVLTVAVVVTLGVGAGVGTYTFTYARGFSYLSNKPDVCINCHIMQDHYDTWLKSSHHEVATCADCHMPHDPVGKYVTKADNGFFHSLAFTLDNFHEPIQIKPRNRRVTQQTCLYCHGEIVDQMRPASPDEEMLFCVTCHRDVGHRLR